MPSMSTPCHVSRPLCRCPYRRFAFSRIPFLPPLSDVGVGLCEAEYLKHCMHAAPNNQICRESYAFIHVSSSSRGDFEAHVLNSTGRERLAALGPLRGFAIPFRKLV